MKNIKGGCLCGKVHYSAVAEPIFSGLCSCTNCQHLSGSTFSASVGISSETFQVKGDPKVYMAKSAKKDPVEIYFCPDCGSYLFAKSKNFPGMVVLKAGCLEDQSWFQPQMNIWYNSAPDWWKKLNTGIPHFPENPTF
ncbi:MAG: GFA family protein [Alphaproteobacteria bacterium]|nr:GFA family protein [Alphaproteobacteria bacterium]